MEEKKSKLKVAESCFDFNKHLNKLHITSDMTPFPDENDARYHARTLEDKTIEVFERDSEVDLEDTTDHSEADHSQSNPVVTPVKKKVPAETKTPSTKRAKKSQAKAEPATNRADGVSGTSGPVGDPGARQTDESQTENPISEGE